MKNEVLFPTPGGLTSICHSSQLMAVGSCFATSISEKFVEFGFPILSNPMGTVFHPIPLVRFLSESLNGNVNERIHQREDVFLSWDLSSSVYALDSQVLETKILELKTATKQVLETASTLFITFGSAHAYHLKTNQEIVANCHKHPSENFTKELTEIGEMVQEWSEFITQIKQVNPTIQFVFTVSPVRYSRDGWVENNRSKARLIELCECLEKESNSFYLPVYELVNDILRDYRYFEKDGVHPNELAIDAVWNLVQCWFFTSETLAINKEMEQINSMSKHRLTFPDSLEAKRFEESLRKKKEAFQKRFPRIQIR